MAASRKKIFAGGDNESEKAALKIIKAWTGLRGGSKTRMAANNRLSASLAALSFSALRGNTATLRARAYLRLLISEIANAAKLRARYQRDIQHGDALAGALQRRRCVLAALAGSRDRPAGNRITAERYWRMTAWMRT